MDTSIIRNKIVLLHIVNEIPELPLENPMRSACGCADNDRSPHRVLGIDEERGLLEAWTFLASTTDDPRKVVAIAIEELKLDRGLAIRLASNHGGLLRLQQGLQHLASILENVAQCGLSIVLSSR